MHSGQYYCDVDIADLIAYDEDIAHRLNNEPGEIIPLVRTIAAERIQSTDISAVRGGHQTMRTEDCLPNRKTKTNTGAPGSPPLLSNTNIDPRPHRDARITFGQDTGYRHWRFDTLFKSHNSPHTMQKLSTLSKHCRSWRICWSQSSKNVRKTTSPWRRFSEVSTRPILCGTREVPIHRSASHQVTRSAGRCASR